MGVMDNLSLTRAPDLEEMEILNHALAHGLSYQTCVMAARGDDPEMPLGVHRSNAGYYLGAVDDEGPVCRDSAEYWPSEAEAQAALENHSWTQRLDPY